MICNCNWCTASESVDKYFTQLYAFMCCSIIVDIMIRVSSKAYSNTCDCLLNEFLLTPLSSQLHEQTVPAGKITCDIHCYGAVKPFMACVCCLCVCRLLQDHHSVQSRSNRRVVCWLFHGPLSAYRRESSSYRRYGVCIPVYLITPAQVHRMAAGLCHVFIL